MKGWLQSQPAAYPLIRVSDRDLRSQLSTKFLNLCNATILQCIAQPSYWELCFPLKKTVFKSETKISSWKNNITLLSKDANKIMTFYFLCLHFLNHLYIHNNLKAWVADRCNFLNNFLLVKITGYFQNICFIGILGSAPNFVLLPSWT